MGELKTLHLTLAVGLAAFCGAVIPGCNPADDPFADSPSSTEPPEGSVGTPDDDDDPTNDPGNQPGFGNGNDGTDPEHQDDLDNNPDNNRDPFEVLAEREAEGPPEIRTRLHSCQKIQIQTLRNQLEALGVDLAATGDPAPAGQLLAEGDSALGAANYEARASESLVWTNAGATKAQDIWVAAAAEIITNLPNQPHCQIDGVGPTVFNEDNTCNPDAIACLIGRTPSTAHLAICDQAVAEAEDPELGKQVAIGALLAAEYTCL